MKRRTLQRWILWLLPLLVLRAFVPAGFMVAAQAGELSLVFCPSVSAMSYSSETASPDGSDPSGAVSVATAHHDHTDHSEQLSAHLIEPDLESHAHHGAQSEASQHHVSGANSCPFALTAVTPAPEIEFFVGAPAIWSYPQRLGALLVSSSGPPRAESIRAPPTFI